MIRNSGMAWGWLARSLHWMMAALILGQWGLGYYAHDLAVSPEKLSLLMWHKSIGISLLLLAGFRLAWALANPRPQEPAPSPPWQQLAARLNHILLYALMLAVPLSGWLMNSAKHVPLKLFRLIPWPSLTGPDEHLARVFEELHEGLVKGLLALILLHAAAALWHHFVRHDDTLRRMLGMRA